MSFREEAFTFECCGESLVGITTAPMTPARVGVLIVVGGPQYRAGSHRQFVMLARDLAARGVPVMRFDYRGMGDSTGEARDFEHVDEDIAAAVDAFFEHVPGLKRVVLWGLCDGASACCFHAPRNPRVAGLVLVNPWVRTPAGEAETYLKHYYGKRLADPRFWKKLLTGGVNFGASFRSLFSMAGQTVAAPRADKPKAEPDLPNRMSAGLASTNVRFAVILSGRDYVAREFEHVAHNRKLWRELLRGPRAEVVVFEAADHTFSSRERRDALALATWDWLVRSRLAGDRASATQ